MTKSKFLALCASMGEGLSFRAKYYPDAGKYWVNLISRNRSGREVAEYLYSTTSLSKAVDAENRFNMWLRQENLHSDQLKAGGAA